MGKGRTAQTTIEKNKVLIRKKTKIRDKRKKKQEGIVQREDCDSLIHTTTTTLSSSLSQSLIGQLFLFGWLDWVRLVVQHSEAKTLGLFALKIQPGQSLQQHSKDISRSHISGSSFV